MSDSSYVSLRYGEESSYGSAAASTTALRFTSESLRQDTQTAISQEIRSDRQIADLVRTGISSSGEIGLEISYGTYDLLFEAGLLSSDWSSLVTAASADTDVSAAAADNSFNRVADWDANPGVGTWIEVRGFATAANNGYFRVASVPTNKKIIVTHGTLVNESATPAITITQGGYITNGTELRSFSFEKAFTDLSNVYEQHLGCCIDKLSLSIATGAIMTASLGIIGKKAQMATSALASPGAATTTDVLNTIDNVLAVFENGSSLDIVSTSIEVSNNLRARQQVATLGAISIGTGACEVTGTLQAYLTSSALMTKYLAFTATSLALVLEDSAGNAYIIDLPRVKFATGQVVAGGISQDVLADFTLSAIRNTVTSETFQIRITRFAA